MASKLVLAVCILAIIGLLMEAVRPEEDEEDGEDGDNEKPTPKPKPKMFGPAPSGFGLCNPSYCQNKNNPSCDGSLYKTKHNPAEKCPYPYSSMHHRWCCEW